MPDSPRAGQQGHAQAAQGEQRRAHGSPPPVPRHHEPGGPTRAGSHPRPDAQGGPRGSEPHPTVHGQGEGGAASTVQRRGTTPPRSAQEGGGRGHPLPPPASGHQPGQCGTQGGDRAVDGRRLHAGEESRTTGRSTSHQGDRAEPGGSNRPAATGGGTRQTPVAQVGQQGADDSGSSDGDKTLTAANSSRSSSSSSSQPSPPISVRASSSPTGSSRNVSFGTEESSSGSSPTLVPVDFASGQSSTSSSPGGVAGEGATGAGVGDRTLAPVGGPGPRDNTFQDPLGVQVAGPALPTALSDNQRRYNASRSIVSQMQGLYAATAAAATAAAQAANAADRRALGLPARATRSSGPAPDHPWVADPEAKGKKK